MLSDAITGVVKELVASATAVSVVRIISRPRQVLGAGVSGRFVNVERHPSYPPQGLEADS